jgi:hypothetical protein
MIGDAACGVAQTKWRLPERYDAVLFIAKETP